MIDETERMTAADAGCIVDGPAGIYGPRIVIELALEHGWAGEDANYSASMDVRWMNDYEAGPSVQADCAERVHEQGGWLDEAEEFLNANVAPEGFLFGWHDGEFFLSPICDNDDEGCDDDACWCHA